MKQKALFLILFLCSPYPTNAEDATQLDQNTNSSFYESFSNFTCTFISLLTTDFKDNIKSAEELLSNLIHTSFNLIQSDKTKSMIYKDGSIKVEFNDTNDQQEFMKLIMQESKKLNCKKTEKMKQKDKGNNQATIIGHFARIASNFFNIAQNPENREIVVPNLLGMFAGMVSIGSEVIKRSDLQTNANLHDIELYVEQLDDELKQEMLSLLSELTQTLSISRAA